MIKFFLGLSLIVSILSAKTDMNVTHIEELIKNCKDGNATACFRIGVVYAKGTDIKKDINRSFEFFHKSCDLNDTLVCVRLADTYASEKSVRYDMNRAIKLYKKSCNLKDAKACDALGHLYAKGNEDLKVDSNLSVQYFMKTCELAEYTCGKIAMAYQTGVKLKQNMPNAIKFHKKACDNNSTRSCSELGRIYLENNSYKKAETVLNKACDLANGWSCGELGKIYEKSLKTISKNHHKSLLFYDKACINGSKTSCSKLGMQYLREKDISKALEYLLKACDKADASACREVALVYKEGKGKIKKNRFKSLKFFGQACQYGDEKSCRK